MMRPLSWRCPYRGVEAFYTLDCSLPTRDSTKYSSPILISNASFRDNVWVNKIENFTDPDYRVDKATVVRIAFYSGKRQIGDSVTLTYFVNLAHKDVYTELPIVSIVCNPEDLFDEENGIYVKGTLYEKYPEKLIKNNTPANYNLKGKMVERSCHVDYFTENYEMVFSEQLGIRIRGGRSREEPQKGFNLYAKEGHAQSIKNIFQTTGESLESIAIMTDYCDDTKIKIPLANELAKDFSFTTAESFPCNVFLNGEYWGIYYIGERYDANYFKRHFDVHENNVLMIKRLDDGTFIEVGEARDIELYNEMLEFVRNTDMTLDENVLLFSEQVDLNSLLDYYCFECCIGNRDWPLNNYALWRSKEKIGDKNYQDGKWRFLLFDTNGGSCFGMNSVSRNIYQKLAGDELIMCLLQNQKFQQMFITRVCDILNCTVEQYHVENISANWAKKLENSYVLDAKLFHADYAETDIRKAINAEIGEFAYLKKELMLNQTREMFNINQNAVDVVLVADNIDDDIIKVNGLPIDLSAGSWSGKYFSGLPIELEFVGENFDGWQILTQENTVEEQNKLNFTVPLDGIVIKALYE